ncbi:hypothetical protein D3C73_1664930 [compost metagenome]
MQFSCSSLSFITLYRAEIYSGTTGIAELDWVTSALFTDTKARPFEALSFPFSAIAVFSRSFLA